MRANRIAVFDTETTGLTLHASAPLDKQPRIIEFGGMILTDGIVTAEVSFLINPGEALQDRIVEITGLTDSDLRTEPLFAERVERLAEFFSSCDHVMAHNLPFDKAMVKNDLLRCGRWEGFPWPARETCTVGLYKEQWGRNPKLKELYQAVMGRPLAQTHRALDDVRALVEIIQEEELWVLA
jgi:DNA polymerase III epsilon subunit-like protein